MAENEDISEAWRRIATLPTVSVPDLAKVTGEVAMARLVAEPANGFKELAERQDVERHRLRQTKVKAHAQAAPTSHLVGFKPEDFVPLGGYSGEEYAEFQAEAQEAAEGLIKLERQRLMRALEQAKLRHDDEATGLVPLKSRAAAARMPAPFPASALRSGPGEAPFIEHPTQT